MMPGCLLATYLKRRIVAVGHDNKVNKSLINKLKVTDNDAKNVNKCWTGKNLVQPYDLIIMTCKNKSISRPNATRTVFKNCTFHNINIR